MFSILTSPQYSEMNSFFCTGSLIKIPQPATSEGANSKCCGAEKPKSLDMPGLELSSGFFPFCFVSLSEMYKLGLQESRQIQSLPMIKHTLKLQLVDQKMYVKEK